MSAELEDMRRRAKTEIAAHYRIFYLGADTPAAAWQAHLAIDALRYVLGDEWFTWLFRWRRAREASRLELDRA